MEQRHTMLKQFSFLRSLTYLLTYFLIAANSQQSWKCARCVLENWNQKKNRRTENWSDTHKHEVLTRELQPSAACSDFMPSLSTGNRLQDMRRNRLHAQPVYDAPRPLGPSFPFSLTMIAFLQQNSDWCRNILHKMRWKLKTHMKPPGVEKCRGPIFKRS